MNPTSNSTAQDGVYGVVSEGSRALEGVVIELYSRSLMEEVRIGSAITDECGRFAITYDRETARLRERKTIDLLVRASHPELDYQPYQSEVAYRAKSQQSFTIQLFPVEQEGTEWGRLQSALPMLLAEADPLKLTQEEVEYLSGTSGIPLRHVAFWIASQRLHQENEAISPSTYYGLLRGGMPDSMDGLAAQSSQDWEQALHNAVRHNRIPESDDEELEVSFRRVQEFSLKDKHEKGILLEAEQADGKDSENTNLNLQLARLLSTQPQITHNRQSLQQAKSRNDEVRDLAYEEMLRREKNMFPELDMEVALEEANTTGQFRNPIRERLARFLEEAVDFDLDVTVIDEYLGSDQQALTDEDNSMKVAVASRLKALQRVYQISPQVDHMNALMQSGLDSAMNVVSLSEEAFVEQFQQELGGDGDAKLVYAQAEQIHATATHLYTSAYQAMNDIMPAALGGTALSEQLRKDLPDWAALFGRIDMCDCEQCRSVYSAAAYFVDLLQFLNPKTLPSGVTERPIDVLRRHRPDLEHLKLTCENTNIVIPYIDLVNEVLESYITHGYSVVNNTAPGSDGEDLNVSREYSSSFPESISNSAATALKHAVFPFTLPYDRHLHTTREYLASMGSNLYELVSTFKDQHPEYAMAGDYLGLSSTERNIWMGRLEREIWEFFGYPSSTVKGLGLLGSYYANANLTGTPVFTRIDPQLNFSWGDDGRPAPTLPAEFSVRWTGTIVPSKTGSKVLHVDTVRGHRFWFNGQKLFDCYNEENPPHSQSNVIQMVAGQAYPIVLEYRCGGGSAAWVHLQWENDNVLEHIPADQLRYSLSWDQHLARVPEFLKRTDLKYEELMELLETRYINTNPDSPNILLAAQTDPCDLDQTVVRNLTKDNFAPLRDIHRFLRLRRKLRVTISELDKMLHALGRERESFLVKLADLKRVQDELGAGRTSLEELLALWSLIDTQDEGSLYHKVFQNKALMNPPDPDFSLLSGGKEIRGHLLPLESKTTQLLAVLRLKENDLRVIRLETGLSDSKAMLTLANLSSLYRYALLSRLLSLSVSECAALIRLTGVSPFRSPSDTLRLIERRKQVETSGFSIGELSYLYRNREAQSQPVAPAETAISKLAETLKAGFIGIEQSGSVEDSENTTKAILKRNFVIQTLADVFDCSVPITTNLTVEVLRSTNEQKPSIAIIEDFLKLDSPAFRGSYLKLHKTLLLVKRLELETEEISYFHTQQADFLGLDFNLFPITHEPQGEPLLALFQQWQLLMQYRSIRDVLVPGSHKLITLFALAKQQGMSLDIILKRLGEMTGWEQADLQALCGPNGWNLKVSHFSNPAKLSSLYASIRLTERLRVPAVKWIAWTKELPDSNLAFEVKNAAKSRYSEVSWRQTAAVIENRLREQWREALVDFVLQLQPIKSNGIVNGNQLFEYFLIDVEMNADMKTSRIKQAISSVQLFVQRSLLNLEPGVLPKALDSKQWEWLKNYRNWEANRKIFLYPENWVEPELRDDKTQVYKELENEILQNDINADNVKQAFGKYLVQLDEIARLDVRAIYRTGDQVHVFARTFSVPHVYYHRLKKRGSWTAWNKIDLDIQGDHLVPCLYNSSLYLFWGITEKTALPKDNVPTSQGGGSTQEQLLLKLGWSEFRNNSWSAKRVSDKGTFLQKLLRDDDEEVMKLNYFLAPRIFSQGNLGIDIMKNFRETGSHGSYYGNIISDQHGTIVFNETRKSTTSVVYAGGTVRSMAPENLQMTGMFLQSDVNTTIDIPYGKTGYYYKRLVPIMNEAQRPLRLVVPHDQVDYAFNDSRKDFTYVQQDYYRTYYAEQYQETSDPKVEYEILFHPLTRAFVKVYNERGVDGLLSLNTQKKTNETSGNTIFESMYKPTSNVVFSQDVREDVDFDYKGAYSVYNWELFFHIPLFLADRLSKEKRYEDALKWYQYVFNPTIDSDESSPGKYWRFLPFNENTEENRIWKLLKILAEPNGDPNVKKELQNQISEWRANPFEPHRIARMRVSSYQKAVVMKYIDTVIAWADDLFSRDTMESINEATQLYVLAGNLLGPRPERIPELTVAPALSYDQLRYAGLDDFSNALVDVQNKFPYIKVQPAVNASGTPIGYGVGRSLYFGIPKNDKLLGYWDTVEDRLYKIRNGLNLDGVARRLALFEAPIDPGAAVRAASAGAGSDSVLSDLNQPLGYYRFSAVLPKALELCAEVKSLGAALLSALEKKDSEELGALRARHETTLYRLIRQVRTKQIEEADKALEGLYKSRNVIDYRYKHYKNLDFMNAFEIAQLAMMGGSAILQGIAEIANLASSVGHAVPNVLVGAAGWAASPVAVAEYGGSHGGNAGESFSRALNTLSSILGTTASMSGTMAGHKRRAEEWKLQSELAIRELGQIDSQIAAAEIRKATAERELANQEKQIEHAEEMEQFLKEKYTGRELYQWMATQLTTLFFQTYQLAYNAAKRAEQAYRFERGLTDSGFIKFGYWDSLRKGLLAGERLHLDLKRLEAAYADQNSRDYELTKSISLVQLDPIALISLRETGACTIMLPEALFDMDHPGHYMRRIKSISITVPCVTGPYTGVHGRLTLMSSRIRISKSSVAPYKQQPEDPRFLNDFSAVQSIAFSHAQNDAGLFELSFRDERYLPFEGAGAVSEWRLELPTETNAFDFDSISDIVLRLSYTAKEGGDALRKAAFSSAAFDEVVPQGTTMNPPESLPAQPNLQRLFSARHEFSTEWHRFMNPSGTETLQTLLLKLEKERFPYKYRGRGLKIERLKCYLKLKEDINYPGSGSPLILSLDTPGSDSSITATFLRNDELLHGLPIAEFEVAIAGQGAGEWKLYATETNIAELPVPMKISIDGHSRLNSKLIEDILILCEYSIA
ncbi:Tc toxin subunit A-related protein [Cohnella herbarum]|uniref:PA14 domain-containing protein n=1 Tax=Cohnella herbarum TaxID=2728023 RepID=A0A7Z2VG79_9BACL|nr:neuraminidase-like domain-containing protein [Cohnella herbarum]QJD82467.1 hypothetical protein HH215_04215 [Cohnella herbarum]